MAQIISGKEVSQSVREKVAKSAAELTAKGKKPGLAVIIVGEDRALRSVFIRRNMLCPKRPK